MEKKWVSIYQFSIGETEVIMSFILSMVLNQIYELPQKYPKKAKTLWIFAQQIKRALIIRLLRSKKNNLKPNIMMERKIWTKTTEKNG